MRAGPGVGQNFFSEIGLFFEPATCPGQLRCLGQNCFSKTVFFWNSHLSRAASLPGADLFLKNPTFFGRSHLSRATSLPGADVFQTPLIRSNLSRAASLPGAELFSQKIDFFIRSHLSWAASLPGAELFFSKIVFFGRNHLSQAASLPGAELLGENYSFEETTCPGQLRRLGQIFSPENRVFL